MTSTFKFKPALPPMTFRERGLLLTVLALLLIASLAPAWQVPASYHQFADQRGWGLLPHALDVLSNLCFAAWGIAGLAALQRWRQRHRRSLRLPQRKLVARARNERRVYAMARLFFWGLLATTAASAFYHWQPDDLGLAVDRAGMVLAFAGLLGLGAALHIGTRAAAVLAVGVVLAGALGLGLALATGNTTPWTTLQLGGLLLVMAFGCLPSYHAGAPLLRVNWWAVLAWYALAKLLETVDASVFALTGQWVSGHSLKHIVASFAAWPVCAALWQRIPDPRLQLDHEAVTKHAAQWPGKPLSRAPQGFKRV